MSLTREDLDGMGCGTAYCDHDHSVLYLHSRCHPYAGIEAAYVKATGLIEVRCLKCKASVTTIQVAQRNNPK